jgi:hypothetical protein
MASIATTFLRTEVRVPCLLRYLGRQISADGRRGLRTRPALHPRLPHYLPVQ